MLGQIFLAVPGRLVPLEHRPGLGVLHHSLHQRGGFGEVSLGLTQFPGQRMKPLGRSVSLRSELVILGELVLLQKT